MTKTAITANGLEDIRAAYPESLGWVVDYLGGYLIRQCAGDRNRLSARLSALGHNYQPNTIYQFLAGRYALPDRGFRGSIEKWQKAAEALKAAELGKLSDGRFPPVETQAVCLFRDYVDALRQPHRICRWGIVVGDTGRQKTYAKDLYTVERNHGQTLSFEAPDTPSLPHLIYTLSKLACRAKTSTQYERVDLIMANIKPSMCVIIDNAQRLYNPRSGNRQDCFSFLQRLQDTTGCVIVLIFVADVVSGYDFTTEMEAGSAKGYFSQIIGRAGGLENVLRLPDHTPDEDLIQFARTAGMSDRHCQILLPVLRYLDTQTGNIRILLQHLQLAAERARRQDRAPTALDVLDHLSIDALDDQQVAKLDKLLAKARQAVAEEKPLSAA